MPVISIYDYSNDLASAFLAYVYTMYGAMEIIDDCPIFIYTVEEVIETSLQEEKMAKEPEDLKIPEKYIVFIKEKNIGDEGTYDIVQFVDETTATLIAENVQVYVNDVIAEHYVENLLEENIESETSEIETEDEMKIIK